MQFIRNLAKIIDDRNNLEESLYASVLEEVEDGMVMQDLWAKSLVQGDFDPKKSKAYYIRERVSRLMQKSKAIEEYSRLRRQEATNAENVQKAKARDLSALRKHEQKIHQLNEELNKVIAEKHALKSSPSKNESVTVRPSPKKTENEQKEDRLDKRISITIIATAGLGILAAVSGMAPMSSLWLSGVILIIGTISLFTPSSGSNSLDANHLKSNDRVELSAYDDAEAKLRYRISELERTPPPSSEIEVKDVSKRLAELENEIAPLFDLIPIRAL